MAPQPFHSNRGTPIALRHTLEALSRLGMRADVVTYPVGRSPKIPGVRYFRVANPLRIRSVPIGFSLRKVWLDLFVLYTAARRLRGGGYFCIHAVEEAAILAVLLARPAGVPVIYDMQSSLAEQMSRKPLLRSALARRLLERCERWLIRSASWTVSSAGLGARARAADPGGRVSEWRYPASLRDVPAEEASQVRKELRVAVGQQVVMYTGTFEDYQGVSKLVEAMSAVLARRPDTLLVLVGAERVDRERLERALERLPDQSYRLLDRQPRSRIPAHLSVADVVVSPRDYGSNLPIKILEYLATGCAIVATDIPAHRSVLDPDRACLVPPTPAGLAEGILSLLEDAGRARALRDAARAVGARELGQPQFDRRVGELYREVQALARA